MLWPGPGAGRSPERTVLCFPPRRRVYKERLGLSSKVVIGYQAHADTATKSGSLTKNKFVV